MNVIVKSVIRDPKKIAKEKIEEFIKRKSIQWENGVKEIISNDAVDTGFLLNSVFTQINGNGFTGLSSADYMKYWEFGAAPHFVPFYGKGGKPILADWGSRVLGLSEEEMLKMGGMVVSTPELAPFRRSLAKL